MDAWHLLTGEYPPQPGGVSDYVYALAAGLAGAGDEVHVWCPPAASPHPDAPGVVVHRVLGALSPADLRYTGRLLDSHPAPRRLLLQWVPHGFGYRSMNVGLCLWLWTRRRRGDRVELMVHEPGLPFSSTALKQNVAALVHRLMAVVLLRAADRVWVSTPAWERRWRPYALGKRIAFAWIPIPGAVPVDGDPAGVAQVRARYAPDGECLVGHFGMHRPVVRALLEPILETLCREGDERVLLIGRGGNDFRDEMLRRHPDLQGRLYATGTLPADEISRHLSACDLMLQAYPDGVNGRQSSMAAVLEHGLPSVATVAESTEPMWAASGGVALVPTGDSAAAVAAIRGLASDAHARHRMGKRAREMFLAHFDWARIVTALRSPVK